MPIDYNKYNKVFLLLFLTLISSLLLYLPFAEEIQLNGNPYTPPEFSYLKDSNLFYSLNWLDYYSIFFIPLVVLALIFIKNKKLLVIVLFAAILLDSCAILYLYKFTMSFCVCRITPYGKLIISVIIAQLIPAILITILESQQKIIKETTLI